VNCSVFTPTVLGPKEAEMQIIGPMGGSPRLHDATHFGGISIRHEFYFAFTTQLRPCQST
ncbi:MAG: hypothetical protein WA867_15570, partial [Candidatus Acidiferrales bacterium]